MRLGAASASASTTTIQAYYQFQAGLEYLDMTIKSSGTNYERFCAAVYLKHEKGGVCGQHVAMFGKNGYLIGNPLVNCAGHSEVFVVMSVCSTPCMLDKSSTCCFVPAEVAYMFP